MEAFALLKITYWSTTAGTATATATTKKTYDFTLNQQLTSNSTQTQPKQGILKSATGFSVLLLNLKSDSIQNQGNMLTLKFDLKGPLLSLFPTHYKHHSASNLGKQMSHTYLNMLKPFYIRLQKMKLSDYTPCTPASTGKSRNNLQAWVNVMRKHLSKSPSTPPPGNMGSNRREELAVDDGIQGAILYCKRSFNS